MRRYTDSVASAVTGLPVLNAQVRVLNGDGSSAQLYSDNGVTPLTQPVLTDSLGMFYFYVADGIYTLTVDATGSPTRTIPGIEIFSDVPANDLAERAVLTQVGETPPTLPPVAATLKYLARDVDGSIVAKDSQAANVIDAITTDTDKAPSGSAVTGGLGLKVSTSTLAAVAGALGVGANDNASGALWTTLQGFINKLLSSAGASVISWIQGGTGAVARTVQDRLRDVLNAKDFGGSWDGVGDDTTALQAAVNRAVALNATLLLPPLVKCGAISISGPCWIQGAGGKTTITAIAGTYTTFTIAGSDITIQDLVLLQAAKTGGADFTIACGTAGLNRIQIFNINSWNSTGFLNDSGSGSGSHTTTRVSRCQARGLKGPGVAIARGFAFLWFNEVAMDYTGVTTSNFTGFSFDGTAGGAGAGGLVVRDCDVLGTSGVTAGASQHGFVITNMAAVRIYCTRADTCDGVGFTCTNIQYLYLDDATSSLCNNGHFVFTSITTGVFRGLNVIGRNSLSGPVASIDGLKFVTGNAAINIVGGQITSCTGHGINKSAAQAGAIVITSMSLFNNTGRGVKSTGNSGFLVASCQFGSNTAGNYDLGGGFDYLTASQLSSGAIVSVGPGPVTG